MTALADPTDPRFTDGQRAHLAAFEAAEVPAEVVEAGANAFEQRVRALIQRIEAINTYQPDGTSRTHWFNCGMDEAYDNVLGWLYSDVLGDLR